MPSTLTHKVLYRSELVSLDDFRCKSGKCGASHEETASRHSIVMPRRGVFVKHVEGSRITADASSVMFFESGRPYRVSHPADCGDDCTSIEVNPGVFSDVLSRIDAARAEDPSRPFAFTHGPTDDRVFLRQSRLLRLLASRGAVGEFEVDEAIFSLVGGLFEGVYAAWRGPARSGRPSTRRAHAETIEAAKARLHESSTGRVSLSSLARSVHTSPFHLSRMFRERTGYTVSRYLTRIRVRHAVTMITGGERDLTRTALSCGFCDQSHMTNAVTREAGIAPGTLRDEPQTARDIRKLIQE